jgi:hypothetical protein
MNYTAATGVFPISSPPSTGGSGGSLVLSSGQAWVSDEEGLGFIFYSDNTFQLIFDYYGDGVNWMLLGESEYSTSGGNITLVMPYGETLYGTYSVSGNTLSITVDGETLVLTKRSGIYPDDYYYYAPKDSLGKRKNPENAAVPKLFRKKADKPVAAVSLSKPIADKPVPKASKPYAGKPEREKDKRANAGFSGWFRTN